MLTQNQVVNEGNRVADQRIVGLTRTQLLRSVVLGFIVWFAGAMSVRFGAPLGVFGPSASAITFVLSVPFIWLVVIGIKKIAKLEAGQTLIGIAVGGIAATFCDGIGMTWGGGLYGSEPTKVVFGAAWLLWGVALFLLFALIEDQRQH